MICCKQCKSYEVIKSGRIIGQQRYKCKDCRLHFVLGDKRVKPFSAIKRAFAVILYSIGKASYGFIAKLFGVTRSAVLKWLRQEGALLNVPSIPSTIKEMEFDEMWHFIGSKKTNFGSSKLWIVVHEELWPGFSGVVMLQPSNASTTKLAI